MKQIVVHYEKGASKVALLENRKLVEYHVEHTGDRERAGNIYKGRVVNVLPGMQVAFIDIGLAKNAFLYIDDLLPAHVDKKPNPKPSVEDLVQIGQTIMVQVMKEPRGTKGARVTTHFTIPGHWLVFLPNADYVAVSKKIDSEDERTRLKKIGDRIRKRGEGLIMRTVAAGEEQEAFEQDLKPLREIWASLLKMKKEHRGAPFLMYRDLDLIPRLIRDLFSEEIEEIIVDDEEQALEIQYMLYDISPGLENLVQIYYEDIHIYDHYRVNKRLEQVYRRKIQLHNGGNIVVDQTEAFTIIDVNTGKFTGVDDLAQTIFQTNLEAAKEILKILRLRDISGMILIDFIDMEQDQHRQSIVEQMEEWSKQDRTKMVIFGWTRLGLLEMTRKKIRHNLDELYLETCPQCSGRGKVPLPK